MAKASHSDVSLAHAACGPIPPAGSLMQAPVPTHQLAGVSVPGSAAAAAAVGLGVSRGGVLGDITNHYAGAPGTAAGGVKTALGTSKAGPGFKVATDGTATGAKGACDFHALSDPVIEADSNMQTPRCCEDMDVDAEDPQNVVEYAGDIYGMLRRDQSRFQPLANYLEVQSDINAKMRAILIDWLVEVHAKYKLKTETLFLAVNLIDRYLEKRIIKRKKLQLVGVTGMLIAAKFEEIYPPEVRDFVYITDKAYTKDEILAMEVNMLTALDFHLNCPTVAHFLERYQRVNGCTAEGRHLMQYVLELTLPEFKMLRYDPSHLVAAAALLINKMRLREQVWSDAMSRHTEFRESDVKACAKEMLGILEAAERNALQAVRKKFSHEKYHKVGKMTF